MFFPPQPETPINPLPYEVYFNKAEPNKILVALDKSNLRPQVSMFLGTRKSKIEKYKKYIIDSLNDGTNMLDTFVAMHKAGKENEEITLTWHKSPSKDINSFMYDICKVIKDILISHQTTFDALTIYVNAKAVHPTSEITE